MLDAVWGAARPRPALVALLGLCLCLGLVAEPLPAAAQEAETGLVPGTGALVAADALLRTQPGYDAAVVTPLLPGTPVDVLGGPIADPGGTRWYSVSFGGQAGYLPAGALAPAAEPVAEPATVPIAEPSAPPTEPAADLPAPSDSAPSAPSATSPPSPATATDLLNLRAGPSYDDAVLRVLPPGAPVAVTGPAQGGFLPVAYDGTPGWIDAAYLT
ncbi:MAG: SH3 domain-containing protein, partial [Chloroflexota bacterium]|nr:SH3 domain-containing protein [Chloroflexota bacterium]